ncbi:hypothetical protein [Polymorphobacter sp.]|uniref:hypothetical protein n=1 Tax=Polymorphobacter sp. TaxID=1909290 RepID=UPI003F72186D
MTAATLTRAEFLKSAERSVIAVNAGVRTAWGEIAGDTSQSSVLALEADAVTEAARQLALMDNALAEDRVTLEGVYRDLEGETVRVSYLRPDGGRHFEAAADDVDIIVVRATVDEAEGTTTIQGFVIL